jgi:hypothetical protein
LKQDIQPLLIEICSKKKKQGTEVSLKCFCYEKKRMASHFLFIEEKIYLIKKNYTTVGSTNSVMINISSVSIVVTNRSRAISLSKN